MFFECIRQCMKTEHFTETNTEGDIQSSCLRGRCRAHDDWVSMKTSPEESKSDLGSYSSINRKEEAENMENKNELGGQGKS